MNAILVFQGVERSKHNRDTSRQLPIQQYPQQSKQQFAPQSTHTGLGAVPVRNVSIASPEENSNWSWDKERKHEEGNDSDSDSDNTFDTTISDDSPFASLQSRKLSKKHGTPSHKRNDTPFRRRDRSNSRERRSRRTSASHRTDVGRQVPTADSPSAAYRAAGDDVVYETQGPVSMPNQGRTSYKNPFAPRHRSHAGPTTPSRHTPNPSRYEYYDLDHEDPYPSNMGPTHLPPRSSDYIESFRPASNHMDRTRTSHYDFDTSARSRNEIPNRIIEKGYVRPSNPLRSDAEFDRHGTDSREKDRAYMLRNIRRAVSPMGYNRPSGSGTDEWRQENVVDGRFRSYRTAPLLYGELSHAPRTASLDRDTSTSMPPRENRYTYPGHYDSRTYNARTRLEDNEDEKTNMTGKDIVEQLLLEWTPDEGGIKDDLQIDGYANTIATSQASSRDQSPVGW